MVLDTYSKRVRTIWAENACTISESLVDHKTKYKHSIMPQRLIYNVYNVHTGNSFIMMKLNSLTKM